MIPPLDNLRAGRGLLAALLAGIAATACLSPNPPIRVRYFRPAYVEVAQQDLPDVLLARVAAAPHLDQRMAWRISDVEFAYDERHRWVSAPSDLVEAGLRRAMRTGDLGTAELRTEILEFEGVETDDGGYEAVVSIACTLRIGHDQPAQRQTFTARTPAEDLSAESLAQAMGTSLAKVTGSIADWVSSTR